MTEKSNINVIESVPFVATTYGSLELDWIKQALERGHLESSGFFSQQVQQFFKEQFHFQHNYFTPSCTDALELAALTLNISSQDEVIVPSFTFPTTAHAFYLRGAQIVFADSSTNHPNINLKSIQQVLSPKTKAICVVHYGGVGLEIEAIKLFCQQNNIYLVEDAAQAIDCYFNHHPLGSFGNMSAFSFHQTKNISCGEGGLLVVNSEQFKTRAEIIREKGTNRQAFIRGEVDKYSCVDIGSSFVGSDLNAALLLAQLQRLNELHSHRRKMWNLYFQSFKNGPFELLEIPQEAYHNAHNFVLLLPNTQLRNDFIEFMKTHHIQTPFHYVALHISPFYSQNGIIRSSLTHAERFSSCLVRLPLFNHITEKQIYRVIELSYQFSKRYL